MKKSITIEVAANAAVFVDKKTGVQTTALNFDFPDYHKGILSITKLSKMPWKPGKHIASITINFKDDDDKTT